MTGTTRVAVSELAAGPPRAITANAAIKTTTAPMTDGRSDALRTSEARSAGLMGIPMASLPYESSRVRGLEKSSHE